MRAFLRRFFSDPKGNVAIMFAIAVVPVIGAMGAAVDYSMAARNRKLAGCDRCTGLAQDHAGPADRARSPWQEWFWPI
jgi:hypothetical protein